MRAYKVSSSVHEYKSRARFDRRNRSLGRRPQTSRDYARPIGPRQIFSIKRARAASIFDAGKTEGTAPAATKRSLASIHLCITFDERSGKLIRGTRGRARGAHASSEASKNRGSVLIAPRTELIEQAKHDMFGCNVNAFVVLNVSLVSLVSIRLQLIRRHVCDDSARFRRIIDVWKLEHLCCYRILFENQPVGLDTFQRVDFRSPRRPELRK